MRWPDGENTSARGWSASGTNAASRRPSGSMRTIPESAATPTRSPQRVAATSLPAGGGDERRWVGHHEALVGGAEQLQRHAWQGLRPGDPHPPCERHDPALRVDGIQGAVGTERRLLDPAGHGVDSGAAEIERKDVA